MTIDTHQRKSMIKENICVFEVFPVCILFNMMLILHYLHKIWQFIYLHKRGGVFEKGYIHKKRQDHIDPAVTASEGALIITYYIIHSSTLSAAKYHTNASNTGLHCMLFVYNVFR